MPRSERFWRRWTLAARLRGLLVAFSVLLVVAGFGLVLVLRQVDEALTTETSRTFPARIAASQLLTSLVDQETGLRGYALTGDARFLEPYRQGVVDEQAARAELERLVDRDDPARVALLTVDAAIVAWRDQYASLRIADGTAGGTDRSIEFGRELFERVRETSAALDARLAQDLEAAEAKADRDRRLAVIVLGAMGVAVLAGVVGLQRALRTAVLGPMKRLAAQVATVSGGEHAMPIRPDGPPDIQTMGAGVESMRLELMGALHEVEDQRRSLERRALELARSNADLEQFAYVASHDLQEPLRKVASFCQLLEQRYGGQLDERADQYIAFAVDGAKRMQRLIDDLLTFSRVGRTSDGFVELDLTETVQAAWNALDRRVQETGARLECDIAPEAGRVSGDASLLGVLFGNLLGNSLKYRHPDRPPRVRVRAAVAGGMVRIDVSDNGIGIPEQYADKVFVIFQRLHGRDEYEGTGIGLALVKKIVEFHGGTISLGPPPAQGACITFELPLAPGRADD